MMQSIGRPIRTSNDQARVKSIKALQAEITALRTEIQALARRNLEDV
jgi:hypothetical protein